MTCRVIDEGQFSRQFRVQTGVRQDCLLSPFHFLLVIDWIMKMTTKQRRNGSQWTLWSQLDDLDFVDDLALLSLPCKQLVSPTPNERETTVSNRLLFHWACTSAACCTWCIWCQFYLSITVNRRSIPLTSGLIILLLQIWFQYSFQ